MLENFYVIDLPALISLVFCCLSCAIVGSFLVVRREALLADAISHSVLPGIVLAFFFMGDRNGVGIFVGALIAAISSAIFIRFLKNRAKMESGASTGVVFSVYFALGVVLLEGLSAGNVDLDVDCVLHGQLETILWAFPTSISPFSLESFKYIPIEVFQSFFGFLLVTGFIFIFFKELVLFSFDQGFAKVSGYRVAVIETAFTALVAIVVVSAFKVVGSILVIALIVCPAAAARMYADTMKAQLFISCFFALVSGLGGYYFGAFLPLQLEFNNSIGVSGVVAVTIGVILFTSVIFAPQYGLLGKKFRIEKQKFEILKEDILAYIFRKSEESRTKEGVDLEDMQEFFVHRRYFNSAIKSLLRKTLLTSSKLGFFLSPEGFKESKHLIRRHRLWESYMVQQVGIKEDHVHESAEELEHIISSKQERYLEEKVQDPFKDPHGKPIPD